MQKIVAGAAIVAMALALEACPAKPDNNDAANAAMNEPAAADMNATDMNAVDMNAVNATDMNAADVNGADVNNATDQGSTDH